jgi:Tol biopolymer transport system component
MRRAVRTFVVLGFIVAAFIAPLPAHATFPGLNGLIAFQADTGSGIQIYTVRSNGHDLFQVTHVDGEATTPDWSPDGHWIAFSLNECTVAMIRSDGSDMRTIPSQTPGGCETDPAFTPDGDHLIFGRFDPTIEDEAIWIMGLNGEDRRRIGTGPGGAATPEISPDGQTVTFLSFMPDDLTAIFAVDISGGPVRQVTPTLNGITFKHDWAPDGSRLVMSDNADNPDLTVNVVTIRPDGTGLMYLTDNQTPDHRAFAGGYSPNGKWIVYRQEIGDQSALMVMRTEGQGTHAILPFSDFQARFIDWGPVPS